MDARRATAVSTVVLLVATLAGCGSTSSPPPSTQTASSQPQASVTSSAPAPSEAAASATATSAAKAGGTLIVALPGDLVRTDPILSNDSNSSYIERQVMQTLVAMKPGTTELAPGLATSWDVSSDGLTYTFHLRQGVKFHDGTDFNAEAVKYNYDRWKNLPESLHAFAVYYPIIFGGFGPASIMRSIDVVDPLTVRINLTQPKSNFLITQTLFPLAISSPAALQAGDANNADVTKSKYAQGGNPAMVGTGPFMFKEWVPGDHVTVVKNPNYWDPATAAYVDQVIFRPFPDQTAELNALQAGEVDVAQTIKASDVQIVKSDPKLQVVYRSQSCNVMTLDMNQSHKPLDNKQIRMAIAYALNRQAYVDTFYAGLANLADNYMPLTIQYAIPMNVPTYNPDMARQLIAQSGVKDPTIDFYYPPDVSRPYMPDPKGLFQAISADLQAVGFKIVPHTEGWTTGYLDDEYAGKFPMWLLGWTCDYPAIDNFLITGFFGYQNGKPSPEFGFTYDDLNKAMQDALAAPGDQEAAALWKNAQDIIAADFPAVPMFNSIVPAAAQAYVRGFVASGNLNERFNTVWLDK